MMNKLKVAAFFGAILLFSIAGEAGLIGGDGITISNLWS